MAGGGRHDIARQRDRHLERQLRTNAAVEGRASGAIVVHPERTACRAKGHAPGVPQDCVLHCGATGHVGYQRRDQVGVALGARIILSGARDRGASDEGDHRRRFQMSSELAHDYIPCVVFGSRTCCECRKTVRGFKRPQLTVARRPSVGATLAAIRLRPGYWRNIAVMPKVRGRNVKSRRSRLSPSPSLIVKLRSEEHTSELPVTLES